MLGGYMLIRAGGLSDRHTDSQTALGAAGTADLQRHLTLNDITALRARHRHKHDASLGVRCLSSSGSITHNGRHAIRSNKPSICREATEISNGLLS